MNGLYKRREAESALDGMWDFAIDPQETGMAEMWYKAFPPSSKIVVPSCWNCSKGFLHYEGTAWYQTEFYADAESVLLAFEGVLHACDVFVDGEHIGEHYGGFTPFSFTIHPEKGTHRLTVRVNNTHDDVNTIPPSVVDWFHYGGIFRSVTITPLSGQCIKTYKVGYVLDDALENAALSVDLTAFSSKKETVALELFLNETCIYRESVCADGIYTCKIADLPIKDIQLWDIGSPHLYDVQIRFGSDCIREKIGFREIKTEGDKIFLNKKSIYLKGINRHDEHPDWGFAVPFTLVKKDIDIIADMGCNIIRGSHYPNSKACLDYCDALGILFWEEIPMWGVHETGGLGNPLILDRSLHMITEMVIRDYQHPCIVIWGLHNEIDTNCAAAQKLTEALRERVKSLDASRLVTYATRLPLEDTCYAFADIIAINKYLGWYAGELSDWDGFIKEMLSLTDGKPLVVSEFGAGGIYGTTDLEDVKWTENYQSSFLEQTLDYFINSPHVSGSFVWQYCDIRTSQQMALRRPRSFNNKGILNEYRKPKMAYTIVKKMYHTPVPTDGQSANKGKK